MFEDFGRRVTVSERHGHFAREMHILTILTRYLQEISSKLANYERQSTHQESSQISLSAPQNAQVPLVSPAMSLDRADTMVPSSSLDVEGNSLSEEVVASVQNPLTSSESFFLVDSSGKERQAVSARFLRSHLRLDRLFRIFIILVI